MAYWGGELSFFQSIHVGIDKRIGMSISIRPMATKSGKQARPQYLTQMRLRWLAWLK